MKITRITRIKRIRVQRRVQTVIIAGLTAVSAFGQVPEFFVGLGGGVSWLSQGIASPVKGHQGLTLSGEMGYTLYFTDRWGASVGVGAGYYSASLSAAGFKSSNPYLLDSYDERYRLLTNVSLYRERQQVLMVNIPFMAHFCVKPKNGFRTAFGLKVGFPVVARYRAEPFTLTNTDDYEYGDPLDGPNWEGIGTFDRGAAKASLSLKPSLSAAIEAGWRHQLNEQCGLYLGLYLDHGLNELRRVTLPFVIPNEETPEKFTTGSIMQSDDENFRPFVQKVRPLAAGAVLRLSFGSRTMRRP